VQFPVQLGLWQAVVPRVSDVQLQFAPEAATWFLSGQITRNVLPQ
jgi:hypothetical protein